MITQLCMFVSGRLSSQMLRYAEKDGYIMVKDIDGTALDSDEYYEYLYEDLIDKQGATASKLVSKGRAPNYQN